MMLYISNIYEQISGFFHINIMIKLLLAMLLGGIIGFEREVKSKPVGIKTCIIISITTCILTAVSIASAEYYATLSDNIRTDPMRLAAQVISGIGFIGTGVILHKNDDVVSGITTAAMIWTAAGIGITIGAGFYGEAIIVAACILLTLKYSNYLKLVIPKKNPKNNVSIVLNVINENVESILRDLEIKKLDINTINIKEATEENIILSISGNVIDEISYWDLYQYLKKFKSIRYIEISYL